MKSWPRQCTCLLPHESTAIVNAVTGGEPEGVPVASSITRVGKIERWDENILGQTGKWDGGTG